MALIHKQHIWTFTRFAGTVEPSLESEGLVLRASWDYHDLHFQVWEPEVADLTKVPSPLSLTSYDHPFFKTAEGAPRVIIRPQGPASSHYANVTTYPVTIDWVATKNPTFQIPKVIYYTQRYGWTCEVTSQLSGTSGNNSFVSRLWNIIGTDNKGYLRELLPNTAPAIEVKRICTSLAIQVADAIVEMSTWEKPLRVTGVSGVDGGMVPDPNLWENHIPLTQEELNQNLDYAQLDRVRTIFGPNDISPYNIIIDQDNNFVGFDSLRNAGFVPQNWISITMLDPEVVKAADLQIWNKAVFYSKNYKLRQNTRDCIGHVWSQHLWDELAKRGFAKANPYLLQWRRTRSVDQVNANQKWKDLNRIMWEQGLSSWAELEKKTEPAAQEEGIPKCPGSWVN